IEAELTTCCCPPPMVTSVSVTPGSLRRSAATFSTRALVAASVEPSGARTLTSNCDWSSTGRKFLPTNLKSGTMLKMTSTHARTTAQRCAIDHRSIHVYVRSIGLYQRDSFDECGACSPCGALPSEGGDEVRAPSAASARLIRRAASIGVSVNETSRLTAMANDEVNPNEDMKRPTIPCMKPTGRKTASKLSV